jgi:ATP-dependent helicase/nuclease subunit A
MAELHLGYSEERKSLFQFSENICLCAGAGSGKTSVLVAMYLTLLSGESSFNEPIPVEQIVAITFTEKAAAEMKSRVREAIEQRLLDPEGKALWEERLRMLERAHIKTIHSFCAGMLREYSMEVAVDPAFAILDEYDASEILEQIVHEIVMEGLENKTPMIDKLIYDYGFSGYTRVSGLKDFLKRLYREIYSSGLGWDEVSEMGDKNYRRAEGILASGMHAVSENMNDLFIAVKEGVVKKSLKSFSHIEALLNHHQTATGIPENKLIERGGEFLSLEKHLGGTWPVAVREIKKDLQGNLSRMKEAYYQLQSHEYLVWFQQLLERIDLNYRNWKLDHGVLDFDDLQIRVRDILKSNRKIRRELKNRFKVIMLDEFQDTNGLQKEIVYYLSEDLNSELVLSGQDSYQDVIKLHPQKLCIVGDPKQSIYRFRGADVAVFSEMQSELGGAEASGTVVSFRENFRSQKGIVEFFNRFFSFIMNNGRERYEVNFNHDDHQEHQRQLQEEGPRVELIKIERGEGSEQKRKIEASAISRRILEVVQPQSPVVIYENDGDGKERRKPHPEFSDIAILLRRFTHIKLYERELRRRNIPYYVVKGRGFFGCQEVKDIINFLKYLDGENDDTALVGILRSPLVGISDETLYWLFKGSEPGDRPFGIENINRQYIKVKSNINNVDIDKIKTFNDLFKELKDKKDRLSEAELIEYILAKTRYDSIMLTTFQGEQKVANLRKLIEISRAFSRKETGLLRDFVTYLLKLVDEDSIESEAQTSLENANVVRLMTIHQAKGLEFPIVFLPDMGHSLRQGLDRLLFDEAQGLALKVYQESKGTYESTLVHSEIAALNKKKEYAESKRLFYVAATRARDYLVLSGEKPLRSGDCWREWLDQFMEKHPGWVGEIEEENIGESSPLKGKSLYQLDEGYQKLQEVIVEKTKGAEELSSEIVRQSCFYSPLPAEDYYITVTALSEYMVCPQRFYYQQQLGLGEGMAGYREEYDKSFVRREEEPAQKMSGLEKGNLAHFVLKHIPFGYDSPKKGEEIDFLMRNQGVSTESDEVKKLKKNIIAFLESDLGTALSQIKEGQIFREMPFMLTLQDNDSPLVIVVQGVIDLLYRDPEGVWTVVDYKYSAGREIDKRRYEMQLMTYALAVAKRMGEDKVRIAIKVIEENDAPLKGWFVTGTELKKVEKQIIADVHEIAKMEREGAPDVWTRRTEEECSKLECVYKKRCST